MRVAWTHTAPPLKRLAPLPAIVALERTNQMLAACRGGHDAIVAVLAIEIRGLIAADLNHSSSPIIKSISNPKHFKIVTRPRRAIAIQFV